MQRKAKTKVLISFAVTVKLICTFVFANADCWFSHAAAQFVYNGGKHDNYKISHRLLEVI